MKGAKKGHSTESDSEELKHKRLLAAMERVKKEPLQFSEGFSAEKIRKLNRKITWLMKNVKVYLIPSDFVPSDFSWCSKNLLYTRLTKI